MPARLVWTSAQDATLRDMRGAGATWHQIAAALSISSFSVIERGRHIGAAAPPPRTRLAGPERDDRNRPPLLPGHPVSWSAITAGSCIAGNAYTRHTR